MNLDFTAEQQAFRQEVREFVRANLPEDVRSKVLQGLRLGKDDYVRWQKILHERGWGAPAWPVEFGGTGWDAMRRYLFDEECAAAGAPIQIAFGLKMLAPVLMQFGSTAQQQRFLPRIVSGIDWWCQGYSEPDAGSDLASLKTRAERDGDHYLVNGQKTWTTYGQHADWIFCLVRTSSQGRPQERISFLLIDMKSPGITLRPIITMDGAHEVNEVWFDNVRVPAENLVGEENKGWAYAKYLLGHERTSIADIGNLKRDLAKLKEIARREGTGTGMLLDDVRFRDRIALLDLEIVALDMTCLRLISADSRGGHPGPEASFLKIKSTELQQTVAELQMQALGHHGLPFLPEAAHDPLMRSHHPEYAGPLSGRYFNLRKTTIYGGSTEIQKNIIAQMIGL